MDPRRILEKTEISVYCQEKKVHMWNQKHILKNKIRIGSD